MKLLIALCCALVAGVSLKAMATAAIWTVEITYRDHSDEARTAMEHALAPYEPKPLDLQRGDAYPLPIVGVPPAGFHPSPRTYVRLAERLDEVLACEDGTNFVEQIVTAE